jgi:hypothetical protein
MSFLRYIHQLPQNLIAVIICLLNKQKPTTGLHIVEKGVFKCGVSLGEYILLDPVYKNSTITIKHEQGHQKQSLYFGWLYLIIIGIPSATGNIIDRIFHKGVKWYYNQPWEKWADKLGGVNRFGEKR